MTVGRDWFIIIFANNQYLVKKMIPGVMQGEVCCQHVVSFRGVSEFLRVDPLRDEYDNVSAAASVTAARLKLGIRIHSLYFSFI